MKTIDSMYFVILLLFSIIQSAKSLQILTRKLLLVHSYNFISNATYSPPLIHSYKECVIHIKNASNYPCQHVGIVLNAGGSAVITIEGNTSINSNDNGGAVMRRSRPRNKSIVAYARPKYEDVPTQPTPTPKKSVDEVAWEIIKRKGGWGDNPGRRQKLEAAGYNYNEVRDRVNQLMAKK